MKKLSLIPLVFVAVSLAACSEQSPEQPQTINAVDAWASPENTANSQSENAPSPTAPNNAVGGEGSAAPAPTQPMASGQGAPQGGQPGAQEGSQKEHLNQIMMKNFTIGETVTISGAPAEICLRGNGYGIGMLAAGPNTSCEFAKAVMSEQIKDRNATDDDIRNSLRSPVDVTSPVTNEMYAMNCSTDADRLITCTGGDNASVFMY